MPMTNRLSRSICWKHLGNASPGGAGLEHLLLADTSADSVVLGVDDTYGPFRLTYRLEWNSNWQLCSADLAIITADFARYLVLRADGDGNWQYGDGKPVEELKGCLDIDIWPTPFTNSFPILRQPMPVGQRREFRMAWVFGPDLSFQPQSQAYTRMADRLYLFESLDGSGFKVELPVDADGMVLDYPGLFQRMERQ